MPLTAVWAYRHARNILKGRFPAGEAAIAKSSEESCNYARDVLKGRFPAGEAAIAKDAHWSFLYARDVLKGRFPAGEAAIATDSNWSYCYALDVLKGRFPKGEAAIINDACWSSEYASNILGQAAKKDVIKSGLASYCYAVNILMDRFPEGEAAISKWPWLLAKYSAFIDSMTLLKSCLSEEEKSELMTTKGVAVRIANGTFFVSLNGLIEDCEGKKLCVVFEDRSLPEGDLMLAKILLLKADPKRMLKLTNEYES
jgi:hypothetical protein